MLLRRATTLPKTLQNLRLFSPAATAALTLEHTQDTQLTYLPGFPRPDPKYAETIPAVPRSVSGKSISAKERKAGRVPSIIFEQEDGQHGGNKRLISVQTNQIRKLVTHLGYSFFLSRLFDVEVRPEIGSDEVIEKVRALPRSATIVSKMAFFGLSRVSRRLLKSSVSATPSYSFSVFQSQHKSLSKPVTTHYTNPFPKYPLWNYNYQVWSKGTELHQEKFLGFGWNYRLVARMSSSVVEGNPKKDDKEKSGVGGVKEASWIDLYLPEEARGYAKLARLDKPIGTWLLAWPCMWSIAVAADPGSLPSFKYMGLFGCGALLLRGAGCTINDLLDRDIDTKVDRTKSRPIASGLLTPFQGIRFLGLQLLLGLGILLQLNNYSRVLGASSLLLVFSYPLMKRFTFWPQAFLGLTINWGALLGWTAVKGSIEPAVVLPLYLSGVCWTLVYDTIYAHQDKVDDVKVGIKSTTLRFGDNTKLWLTGFGTTSLGFLAISGLSADLGWQYYASLATASGQLGWQIGTADLSSRADCN